MDWREDLLDLLARTPCCGYHAGQPAGVEPTSLATMALAVNSRPEALIGGDWLAAIQSGDGSLGVRAGEPTPCWPTGLAILAWLSADAWQMGQGNAPRYRNPIRRAASWILSSAGAVCPQPSDVAHDTTLVAWPWVAGTDSWIEPTAVQVIALRAVGLDDHDRTHQAVRMILDRQLPSGGWNYGNTFVLGQKLRPHLQPTALSLLALRGLPEARHAGRSIDYLSNQLAPATTCVSLCWSLMGLAAHGRSFETADSWLASAWHRPGTAEATLSTALLALASRPFLSPLVSLPEFSS